MKLVSHLLVQLDVLNFKLPSIFICRIYVTTRNMCSLHKARVAVLLSSRLRGLWTPQQYGMSLLLMRWMSNIHFSVPFASTPLNLHHIAKVSEYATYLGMHFSEDRALNSSINAVHKL